MFVYLSTRIVYCTWSTSYSWFVYDFNNGNIVLLSLSLSLADLLDGISGLIHVRCSIIFGYDCASKRDTILGKNEWDSNVTEKIKKKYENDVKSSVKFCIYFYFLFIIPAKYVWIKHVKIWKKRVLLSIIIFVW